MTAGHDRRDLPWPHRCIDAAPGDVQVRSYEDQVATLEYDLGRRGIDREGAKRHAELRERIRQSRSRFVERVAMQERKPPSQVVVQRTLIGQPNMRHPAAGPAAGAVVEALGVRAWT